MCAFGMAGTGFVFMLALSITCNLCINRKCKTGVIIAPTESIEQQSNETVPQSTVQTSSYDYIDDIDLLSYTDLVQSIVSRVPNRDSRAANSIASSERSYVVPVDHTIDVQLHTYQSMTEINNTEADHHYMEIKNSKAPSFLFWPSEYRRTRHRNSLGDLKHMYSSKEASCKKRAIYNSWPQESKKCTESVVKLNWSVRQNVQDSINPGKRRNVCIGTKLCESSLEAATRTIETIDLVTRDEVSNLDYSQASFNWSDITANYVLTDRICRHVDNQAYFSTISSPSCLSAFNRSLQVDPK